MNSYFVDSFQMYIQVPTKEAPTIEDSSDGGEGNGPKNL